MSTLTKVITTTDFVCRKIDQDPDWMYQVVEMTQPKIHDYRLKSITRIPGTCKLELVYTSLADEREMARIREVNRKPRAVKQVKVKAKKKPAKNGKGQWLLY